VQFPVYIPFGPLRLHPHVVFEALAYFIGFRIYLRQRRRRGDVIADGTRWSIIAAAIAGAAIGSKVLYWFEDPVGTWQHLRDPVFLLQGKTIVGALIGGLIGVEATKFVLGVRESTGDLFAVPLAIGAALGRIGCFLTGLSDRTYGVQTNLPWASISAITCSAIRHSCTRRSSSPCSPSRSSRSPAARTRTETCSSCSWWAILRFDFRLIF
jgi:phosphatidylglycerol---prolipoprotein diacylglyceryl transferase